MARPTPKEIDCFMAIEVAQKALELALRAAEVAAFGPMVTDELKQAMAATKEALRVATD